MGKQTKVPADQCEAMVKQGLEKILEKECPSELEAFPVFPAPLCDKLKAKEDAVVTGVCAKQTKVPVEQCEVMVKQGLEKILEKECPSELEAFPVFPAPLCDKLKAKEDAVVTGVCAKQTKVPAEQCEAMVKQGFEKILEKQCPSELEAFPAFPAPLCDKLKENEDAVVTGICSKQTKVPTDQCAANVKEGLDKIISTQCSGQVEAT